MTYWFDLDTKATYTHSETPETKALFPVSLTAPSWHSGIHISQGTKDSERKPIHTLLSGKIIAYRLSTSYLCDKNGDSEAASFFLIEHMAYNEKNDTFTYYTLYTHLAPQSDFTSFIVLSAPDQQKECATITEKDIAHLHLGTTVIPFYRYLKATVKKSEPFMHLCSKGYAQSTVTIRSKEFLVSSHADLSITIDNDGQSTSVPHSLVQPIDAKTYAHTAEKKNIYNRTGTLIGTLAEGSYEYTQLLHIHNTTHLCIRVCGKHITHYTHQGLVYFKDTHSTARTIADYPHIHASLRILKNDKQTQQEKDTEFIQKYYPLTALTDNSEALYKHFFYCTEKDLYTLIAHATESNHLVQQWFQERIRNRLLTRAHGIPFVEWIQNALNKKYDIDAQPAYFFYNENEISSIQDLSHTHTLYFAIKKNTAKSFALNAADFATLTTLFNAYRTSRTPAPPTILTTKTERSRRATQNTTLEKEDAHRATQYQLLLFFRNTITQDEDNQHILPYKITTSDRYSNDLPVSFKKGSLYISEAQEVSLFIRYEDIHHIQVKARISQTALDHYSLAQKTMGIRLYDSSGIAVNHIPDGTSFEIPDPHAFFQTYKHHLSKDTAFLVPLIYTEKRYNASIHPSFQLAFSIDTRTHNAKPLVTYDSVQLPSSNMRISAGSVLGSCAYTGSNPFFDVALCMLDNKGISCNKHFIPSATVLHHKKATTHTGISYYFPHNTQLSCTKHSCATRTVYQIQVTRLPLLVYPPYFGSHKEQSSLSFIPDDLGSLIFFLGYLKFSYANGSITPLSQTDTATAVTFTDDQLSLVTALLTSYFTDIFKKKQQNVSSSYNTKENYYTIAADVSSYSFSKDRFILSEMKDLTLITITRTKGSLSLPLLYEKEAFSDELTPLSTTDSDLFLRGKPEDVTIEKKKWKLITLDSGSYYVDTAINEKDTLAWKDSFIHISAAKGLLFSPSQDFKDIFDPSDLTRYADFVHMIRHQDPELARHKLRNLACTHPLEWDSQIFKAGTDFVKALKRHAINIDMALELSPQTDIFNAISSLKGFSTNSLCFYHPVTFLEKLSANSLLEINPYLGKLFNGVECTHNPGFAPYVENHGYTETYDGYVSNIQQHFNNNPSWRTDDYLHEGVDFTIFAKDCGNIPIHALISGQVVYEEDFGDGSYGNCLVIKGTHAYNGYNLFYLLAHLDRSQPNATKDTVISPMTIVGYVGNTGNCVSSLPADTFGRGAHLHVHVYKTKKDKFKQLLEKGALAKNQPIVNPFNYEDVYVNGIQE